MLWGLNTTHENFPFFRALIFDFLGLDGWEVYLLSGYN